MKRLLMLSLAFLPAACSDTGRGEAGTEQTVDTTQMPTLVPDATRSEMPVVPVDTAHTDMPVVTPPDSIQQK